MVLAKQAKMKPRDIAVLLEALDKDVIEQTPELEALTRNVQRTFSEIIEQIPYLPEELQMAVANLDDPAALVHRRATQQRIGFGLGEFAALHQDRLGAVFAQLVG